MKNIETSCIHFRLGEVEYLLEISFVVKILSLLDFYNLDGKMDYPIIRIKEKIDFDDSRNIVVLVYDGEKTFGILVDYVYDVMKVDLKEALRIPESVLDDKNEHIKGVIYQNEIRKLLLLLDEEKLKQLI